MLIFTITESLLQKVVNVSPVIYQNKTVKDPRKKKQSLGSVVRWGKSWILLCK